MFILLSVCFFSPNVRDRPTTYGRDISYKSLHMGTDCYIINKNQSAYKLLSQIRVINPQTCDKEIASTNGFESSH